MSTKERKIWEFEMDLKNFFVRAFVNKKELRNMRIRREV